ncbi:hypothetical protein DSO57_1031057 [Entomophthora muscae]|uniref:Uncharacterized protein n=1 Tax=Entomophthora muscae TaxID=34485 RepID=A0ACC2T0V3_9FUNG|nr:hypothetical protein DSO57_1031057 [Entomophthora muscae]
MVTKSLFPADHTFTKFQGFVKLLGKEYLIKIRFSQPIFIYSLCDETLGKSLNEKGISIEACPTLSLILKPHLNLINQKLSQFSNFDEFWTDINQLLEKEDFPAQAELVKSGILVSEGQTLPSYYATVLKDIEFLGWDKVEYLCPDLRQLRFKMRDLHGRTHIVHVDIPALYPLLPPSLVVETPNFSAQDISLPLALKGEESWFKYLIEETTKLLEKFNDFWLVMDELDTETTILEPHPILRSHCHRRISLQALCSLEVEIDPIHPRAIPVFRLYGPNRRVQPLKASLEQKISQWNHDCTPKENFENALGLSFKESITADANQNQLQECGICYSYRILTQVIDGSSQTPTLVCDNPSCNSVFHHSCLFESIKSLPSSRRSYKVWFGSCPYCNEPMNVTEI